MIPFAELAFEEADGHLITLEGESWVVAVAFITQEGVLAVELVPGEVNASLEHGLIDQGTAFIGHVRVLPAPDHHHLAAHFRHAVEGVILHALAEAAFMDIRGVETNSSLNIGIQGRPEREMTTDADAHDAEIAGAMGIGEQGVQGAAGVGVVTGEGLGGLELVAAIGTRLIVGKDGSGRLELVINLRDRDDKTVTGEQRGGPADGTGHLENLRVEQDTGIAAGGGRPEEVRPHRSCRGGDIFKFFVGDGHSVCGCVVYGRTNQAIL